MGWHSLRLSGSSGGGSSEYPRVNTVADLPDNTMYLGNIYVVLNDTGFLWTKKAAGLYYARSTGWVRLGDLPEVFDTSKFMLKDSSDPTKNLEFDISGVTPSTQVSFKTDKSLVFDDSQSPSTNVMWSSEKIQQMIGSGSFVITSSFSDSINYGTDADLLFVKDRNTFYAYTYTTDNVDDKYVLVSKQGGDYKWVGIGGVYVYESISIKNGFFASLMDGGVF